MPNFWSKLTQNAYECFNGPRTKDFDINKKTRIKKKKKKNACYKKHSKFNQ